MQRCFFQKRVPVCFREMEIYPDAKDFEAFVEQNPIIPTVSEVRKHSGRVWSDFRRLDSYEMSGKKEGRALLCVLCTLWRETVLLVVALALKVFLGEGLSLGGSAKFVWEAEGEEVQREGERRRVHLWGLQSGRNRSGDRVSTREEKS